MGVLWIIGALWALIAVALFVLPFLPAKHNGKNAIDVES
jgi:hypothetical protein